MSNAKLIALGLKRVFASPRYVALALALCAACDSVIITGLLPLAGASGVLAFLPLRGGGFGIVGIVLLATSIAFISKKIAATLVCAPQLTEQKP